MDGTDPDVESVIMEYLKGLLAKAEQSRADKVAAPPDDVPVDPAEESGESQDERMSELAAANGLPGSEGAEACPECGKPMDDGHTH